jgi:hypothetical protein
MTDYSTPDDNFDECDRLDCAHPEHEQTDVDPDDDADKCFECGSQIVGGSCLWCEDDTDNGWACEDCGAQPCTCPRCLECGLASQRLCIDDTCRRGPCCCDCGRPAPRGWWARLVAWWRA